MPSVNSKAAGNFFGMLNAEGPGGLNRKVLLIGQQLSTKDLDLERRAVSGAAEVGSLTGRGSVLHRLAIAFERGSKKQIPMAILPQDEIETGSGGVKATGTLTYASGPTTEAGVARVRVNGDDDLIAQVSVAVGATAAAVATALYAELVKLLDAPCTFADDAGGVLTFTAKNTGTFGNFISIEVLGTTPTGLTATVSAMSGGASDPTMSTALATLANNAANDTAIAHGYDIDGTVYDDLSDYNGEGNEYDGLYQKEIGRPFRSLGGDVDKNYSTITAFADARKTDRTNGIASLPGCKAHVSEIAASILGVMERVNSTSPAAIYEGEKLTWIPVPAATSRYWEIGTDGGYEIRDAAVRKGITPVIVIDGVYTLQNISTFYHPDEVDEGENGWIDMSDISITQNVLQYMRDKWSSDEWTGVLFVSDVSKVGTVNPDGTALDRSKFKDRTEVVTELIEAAKEMQGFGWLYESDYTIEDLQANPANVAIRANGTGFDYSWKLWYRLKGYIKDGTGYFNVGGSIAA